MNAPPNGDAKSREYWNIKALKELMDERERRTEDRFTRERADRETSVSAALAAQKEQTRDAFLSSEKAIVKAESAQTAHNLLATELQDRLDRQATNFIARPEFDSRIIGIESKIADMRENNSGIKGERRGGQQTWQYVIAALGALIGILGFASRYMVPR